MSQARPMDWWRQARNDLDLAAVASRNGYHAQACFFATQAAEKALKGAIIELGLAPPHTLGLPKLVNDHTLAARHLRTPRPAGRRGRRRTGGPVASGSPRR